MRPILRVGGQFLRYASGQRQWWLLVLVVILGVVVAVLSAGHAAAPYTIYTLF